MTKALTFAQLQEQLFWARSAVTQLAATRKAVDAWLLEDHERRESLRPDAEDHLNAGISRAQNYATQVSLAASCLEQTVIACSYAYQHLLKTDNIAQLAGQLQSEFAAGILGAVLQPQIISELAFQCALIHPQAAFQVADVSSFFAPEELRRLVFDPSSRWDSARRLQHEQQVLMQQVPACRQVVEQTAALLAALNQRQRFLSGDLPPGWLTESRLEPESPADKQHAELWMRTHSGQISVRWTPLSDQPNKETADLYSEDGVLLARLTMDKTLAH
jgi:K+-sensing histidine kinase KdpD